MECEACGAVSCGNLYCALCIHRMSITEESKVALLTACFAREERLRDECGKLKAERFAFQKQLCKYQLAEIGSKLVEGMEDDEDAATR